MVSCYALVVEDWIMIRAEVTAYLLLLLGALLRSSLLSVLLCCVCIFGLQPEMCVLAAPVLCVFRPLAPSSVLRRCVAERVG